jgi:hypothetical protein
MGEAPEAMAVTGLAPATGHPATHAESPERHVATVMAAAVAAAPPAARATTAERAATTTPHFNRNVAAQGICQKVRSIPHVI